MLIRSGKIQFLFWTAFFSVMVFIWLASVGFQTFILPDEIPMEMPQNVVTLMFVLYGLLVILLLSGTIVSTMIDSRFYQKFFGICIIVALAGFLFVKGMFG